MWLVSMIHHDRTCSQLLGSVCDQKVTCSQLCVHTPWKCLWLLYVHTTLASTPSYLSSSFSSSSSCHKHFQADTELTTGHFPVTNTSKKLTTCTIIFFGFDVRPGVSKSFDFFFPLSKLSMSKLLWKFRPSSKPSTSTPKLSMSRLEQKDWA